LRREFVAAPCVTQEISARVEAAVLSRTRLDLRVMTRAVTTARCPEIDCPSFGERLFWPPYRLLNANEFSTFPPILGVIKKIQSICEIDCAMQSNPWLGTKTHVWYRVV